MPGGYTFGPFVAFCFLFLLQNSSEVKEALTPFKVGLGSRFGNTFFWGNETHTWNYVCFCAVHYLKG